MRYALQRIAQFFAVFVLVTFLVFITTRVGSKDPARDLAGGTVQQELVDQVTARYHLDAPLPIQYGYWLKDLVTFDFGYSYAQSQNVTDMFKQRLPNTFFISFWAILIGLVLAVPIGVYSAYRRDGPFDRSLSFASFGALSIPALVLAVLLRYVFAVKLKWLPADSDYIAPWDNPWEHFRNFFLPSITLGLGLAAVWSRFLRADMALTLQSDFIMLARAKGMSPQRVLWRHALRSSILSLITSVALQMSGLIGGAVVAEQVFAMPGVGDRLVFAVQGNDLLTLQAIAAVLVAIVVFVNLVVDLLYSVVDPRIRHVRALG
ncbi:MAG: ABC transporter permease [Acidimicrobiia bacterium]